MNMTNQKPAQPAASHTPLEKLLHAAERINVLTEEMCLRDGTGKDRESLLVADVWASVDEDGETPRLTVDIERFRHSPDSDVDEAISDVTGLCRMMGFDVKLERSIGSGRYGSIHQLTLTAGGAS